MKRETGVALLAMLLVGFLAAGGAIQQTGAQKTFDTVDVIGNRVLALNLLKSGGTLMVEGSSVLGDIQADRLLTTDDIDESMDIIGGRVTSTELFRARGDLTTDGDAFFRGDINYDVAGTMTLRNTACGVPGSEFGDISFQTTAHTCTTAEAMRITGDGNVGIGTPDPQSKLAIDNGYLQLDTSPGLPPAGDCDSADEIGRMKVDESTTSLYVCTAVGWIAK